MLEPFRALVDPAQHGEQEPTQDISSFTGTDKRALDSTRLVNKVILPAGEGNLTDAGDYTCNET